MDFLYSYLTHDRSDEVDSLNQSAKDGYHDITVRVDHNYEWAIIVFNFDELMWDAIEGADPSMFGETYEERCEMDPADLEGEMEWRMEAHIGAILQSDRGTLEWTPYKD